MAKRYKVVGLGRSGNHAIINWIAYHFKEEEVLLMNNIDPNEEIFSNKNIHTSNKKLSRIGNHKPFIKNSIDKDPINYECLLYTYEDRNLFDIPKNDNSTIFILRDPYNLTASRINNKYYYRLSIDDKYIDYLKQYLREFSGKTNIIENKILVNYNEWFVSKEYRISISEKLDLEFSDAGYGKMSEHGKGSSFDGVVEDASNLDVLNRWNKYKNNSIFKKIAKDEEINELSGQIFGNILNRGEHEHNQ